MEPLKNKINRNVIEQLARDTHRVWPFFQTEQFEKKAVVGLASLALKERIDQVVRAWHRFLPKAYPDALEIVQQTLPPPFESESGWGDTVFLTWFHAHFVQCFGLSDLALSLRAMVEITMRGTCEFAIRPYLKRYPNETRQFLASHLTHPNPHVRRLISEGTRPRLPWGERLDELVRDPSPNLPLLNALRADASKYVRTSVANHIGDIAKDHPFVALKLLGGWMSADVPNVDWVAARGLRHLVKQGDKAALALLGYGDVDVRVTDLVIDKRTITIGESVTFSFVIEGMADGKLNVDYGVYFQGAKGEPRRKVFKLKSLAVSSGSIVPLRKTHRMASLATRRIYPGRHVIEVLINGQAMGQITVDVIDGA